MATSDFGELKQLMLQIERDLIVQTQLRTLLSDVDATLNQRRRRLRMLKARIKRARAAESASAV